MKKNLSTVQAIANCKNLNEEEALNLIQSYILGWTEEETALRIVKANNGLTAQDIRDYQKEHGNEAADALLLLAGPDNFDGSYDEYDALLCELEGGTKN